MAFPAIQSETHQAYVENTASLVITKPSGLASGELMIAVIGSSADDAGGAGDITPPSGWTNIINEAGGTSTRIQVFTKTADSADAAASNFTFTQSDVTESTTVGSIFRMESTSIVTNYISGQDNGGDSTVSFSASQSSMHSDTLLIMAFLGKNTAGTNSYSSYVINGTNPTWTEKRDTYFNGDREHTIAIATAEMSDIRTITSYGATAASAWPSFTGTLLFVHKQTNATPTVEHLAVTATINNLEVTQLNQSPAIEHANFSPTLNDLAAESIQPTTWTTITKS